MSKKLSEKRIGYSLQAGGNYHIFGIGMNARRVIHAGSYYQLFYCGTARSRNQYDSYDFVKTVI